MPDVAVEHVCKTVRLRKKVREIEARLGRTTVATARTDGPTGVFSRSQ